MNQRNGKALKHGHWLGGKMSATYKSWCAAKSRCRRVTDPAYERYGGAGITFDTSWNSFEDFLADMGERPEGTSLDRIDNAKGYTKDNCRWATRIQQANNRKDVHSLTHNGVTKTLGEWAEILGIKEDTLYTRYKRGCTPEQCLAPVRKWVRRNG